MNIGFFGTPDDAAYLTRFRACVGAHSIMMSRTPEQYLASFAAKCKAHNFDAVIVTNSDTMTTLLKALPDFKHPVDKRGSQRKLSLDDYAGSFFSIPAYKLGTEHDIPVLVLNPLRQLVTTPEGEFVFRRFISKITNPARWFPQTQFTWQVWTPATSAALLAKFSQARLLSVDIETYVGDPERRIHCVGYCALFPDGTTHSVVVPFKCMLAHAFVRNLNASAPAKIFQNGLYDNLYFLRWNVPVNNWLHDTQHLFHSWYAELPKRLDFITAFMVRDVRFWKDDASAGTEHDLFEYNARDCWATLHAYCALVNEVPKWAITNYLLEFPMVFPCLHTEADGLWLDKAKFDAGKAAAEVALEKQRAKLAAWIGPDFNPASPDQCKRLLTVLGIKGVESADAKAMNAAAAVHPFNELIISAILAYRKQAKLLSTYFKWDKFWLDRLFYKTNPAGTDTGRMASAESSFWCGLQIQNIPGGGGVKDYIGADEGYLIGEADFSQAEARGVAYLSGCQALMDLVESDKDYHSWNAHKFFGVAYEAVTKPVRNLSKRVNHGANYNMGAAVLLETMGPKAVAEARTLLDLPPQWTLIMVCQHLLITYERTYPEVKKDWYDDIKRKIRLTKMLVSALGWTRYFFADPSTSKPALNAAVAHGPQNLNTGILNSVFYPIWRASVYGDLRGRLRIKAQIHDSILFTYRVDCPEVPREIQKRMQVATPVTDCKGVTRNMIVPSDVNAGKRYWGELK